MTKVMILGASYLQVPLIKQLNKMNIKSVVVDQNKNARGVKYSDYFYQISTLDQEKVLELAKEVKPDAILTTATDMPMRTVAYVSEELGLNSISYQTALNCTDKLLMGETLEKNNVNTPKFNLYNKNDNSLNDSRLKYPLIIKPTDSSGSRGVYKVNNKIELEEKIKESLIFSRSGNLLIEEYIEGKEVSVEILIQNSNIMVVAITDKMLNRPFFIELGHLQPTQLDDKEKSAIIDISREAVKALNITDGAAHVEIRLDENTNIPYIIEVGARLGGGYLTSHLTPKVTDVNMLKGLVNIALGHKVDIIEERPSNEYYSVQFAINKKAGKFKGLENIDEVLEKYGNNIVEYEVLCEMDEKLSPTNSGTDRVVYFMIKTKNYQEQYSIGENIRNLLKIIVE